MLFLILACQETVVYEDVTVELADISTVFTVTWESQTPTRAWVEYGRGALLTRQTNKEVNFQTSHEIVVAGLPEGTDWNWRVGQESEEGEVVYGELHPYEAGHAPDEIESLEVLDEPASLAGFILVPIDDQKTINMYDMEGNLVWWYELEDGFLSQARFINGRVWFNNFPKEDTPDNYIYSVSLDQEDVQVYNVPNAHHDFLVNDQNLIYIQRDLRTGPNDTPWVGDRIMIRPIENLDPENEKQLWSTWDFVEQTGGSSDFYSDGWDWTHCNSLTTIPETGEILMSSKMQEAIYAINPSGDVSWVAGGTQSTMTLDGGTPFGILHGLTYADDTLWLFDNRPKDRQANSRVLAYTVDEGQQVLMQTFSQELQELNAFVHGNAEPMGDGRVLGVWGNEGAMAIWDEAGNIDAQFKGGELGYAHFISHLGGPK